METTLLKNIVYIESLGNYTKLFINNVDTPIIIYGSLSSIAIEIDSVNFVQIHRSFIVNKHAIQTLTSKTLTMSNSEVLPIGRKYQILIDNLNLLL
ncbi:LytTR family DNA-binding domain-containing protein [Flavobacterium branchiarum]|uniref:LytR/AlgR family response regulator transcription factor n=1 Tax=Flavobacterium branchiarum TaxID=1114870 RepID=A0ABV5FQA9_9FLAO|nr:LytTR family DNA-binding domain-containing protein [Flavobacterium branchiarum]MDN3673224.1 LytTR family DNA-binding domain-containing protein [Flavobacterium branchiarum]